MKAHQGSNRIDIKGFEALCREQGIPLTWQRRLLFETLSTRRDHPTADQLYEDLRDRVPGLSRTTVYRGLETLVRLGVAARASHPGSAARFDPVTRPHHHFLCQACGTLADFDPAGITLPALPASEARAPYSILDYTIYFRGLCAACLGNPEPGSGEKEIAS